MTYGSHVRMDNTYSTQGKLLEVENLGLMGDSEVEACLQRILAQTPTIDLQGAKWKIRTKVM